MPTYRTQKHLTDRILGDWILKERLAFNLEPSLTVAELQEALPEKCKQQLGELKPTDNTFRKLSSGFNKVSDVWIELMRFVGVQDFSPEQAIFGTVSTFLDSENVRVKLNTFCDGVHRKNSIEVFCLKEPSYQGLIRYEGERLSFPPSIFEAVIDRRLNVYSLYCENLSDLLLISGVSDPQSLLIAENNARLAEEHRGLDEQPELDEVSDEDPWMDSDDAELEVARNEEAARDAYLRQLGQLADERDRNQLIGSLINEDPSDDAITLDGGQSAKDETEIESVDGADEIPPELEAELWGKSLVVKRDAEMTTDFDGDTDDDVNNEAESLPEAVGDTDEDAEIEVAVDGHSSEIDGEIALTSFDYEKAEDELAERMAEVYSGDVEIEDL